MLQCGYDLLHSSLGSDRHLLLQESGFIPVWFGCLYVKRLIHWIYFCGGFTDPVYSLGDLTSKSSVFLLRFYPRLNERLG
jgi:hypothetical protein